MSAWPFASATEIRFQKVKNIHYPNLWIESSSHERFLEFWVYSMLSKMKGDTFFALQIFLSLFENRLVKNWFTNNEFFLAFFSYESYFVEIPSLLIWKFRSSPGLFVYHLLFSENGFWRHWLLWAHFCVIATQFISAAGTKGKIRIQKAWLQSNIPQPVFFK